MSALSPMVEHYTPHAAQALMVELFKRRLIRTWTCPLYDATKLTGSETKALVTLWGEGWPALKPFVTDADFAYLAEACQREAAKMENRLVELLDGTMEATLSHCDEDRHSHP